MDEFNFENEIDQADWSILEDHYKRDAIFIVEQGLALQEVAKALAADDLVKVKNWLEEKKLTRPTKEQAESWETSKHEKLADFIIVQPYVLIQLLHQ